MGQSTVDGKLLPLVTHFSLHSDSSLISVPVDQENSHNVFQTFFQVSKAANESGACMRHRLSSPEISFQKGLAKPLAITHGFTE